MQLYVLSSVLNSTGSYLTLKVIGEQPIGAGMMASANSYTLKSIQNKKFNYGFLDNFILTIKDFTMTHNLFSSL